MHQGVVPKREMIGGTPVPAEVPHHPTLPATQALMVTTTETKHEHQGLISAILGEYSESGINHGRKVFKKKKVHEDDLDVLIYYWDDRNGPDYQGWWSGTGVGSTEAWSHSSSSSQSPPSGGWKIPHDGPVCKGLFVNVITLAQPEVGVTTLTDDSRKPSCNIPERSEFWSSVAFNAVQATKDVSLKIKQDPITLKALHAMDDSLKEQAEILAGALQELQEVPTENITLLQQRLLMNQGIALRTCQTQIRQSMAEVKRVSREMSTGADEAKEQALLNELLPTAQQRLDDVVQAVMEAERAAAACTEAEEVEEVDLEHAETLVAQAQHLTTDAISKLVAQQKLCRTFVSMKVRQLAMDSLGGMKESLSKQQQRITPLKSLRRNVEQQSKLAFLKQEALSYLSPPEAQLEQVREEMSALRGSGQLELTGNNFDEAAVSEISSMLDVAESELQGALSYLEMKRATMPPAAQATIEALMKRAHDDTNALVAIRNEINSARTSNSVKVSFREEVDEAFLVVERSMREFGRLQQSLKEGGEGAPLAETLNAMQAADAAATKAEVACQEALSLVEAKMREVCRLGSSSDLTPLKEWQNVALESSAELHTFHQDLEVQRRKLLLNQATEEVEQVVELAKALEVSATILGDDAQVMELTAPQLQSHAEVAMKQESLASKAFLAARKLLSEQQLHYKNLQRDPLSGISSGSGASGGAHADSNEWRKEAVASALNVLQSELTTAQTSCAKSKRICDSLKSRLLVKGLLEDLEKKLFTFEQSLEPLRVAWENGQAAAAAAAASCTGSSTSKESAGSQSSFSSLSASAGAGAGTRAGAGAGAGGSGSGSAGAAAVVEEFVERSRKAKEASAAVQSSMARLEKHPNILSSVVESKRKRMKDAEALLSDMMSHSKELAESTLLQRLVAEVTSCLEGLEGAMKKVHLAEEPFAVGVAVDPNEKSSQQALLLALEAAVQEAVDHAKVTRSVLAEKKDSVKQKFAVKAVAAQASTALENLEEQLKSTTKTLAATKRAAAVRKAQMLQSVVEEKSRLLNEKVAETESLRQQVAEATAASDAQAVRSQSDRAAAAHQELLQLAEATRQWAEEHEHGSGGSDPSLQRCVSRLLEEARSAKAKVEQGKSILRGEELRFVAERLKQEASAMVEGVREKLKTTKSLAALAEKAALSLARSDTSKLTQMVMLLRRHLKATRTTVELWFEEIADADGGERLSQDAFVKSTRDALQRLDEVDSNAFMQQDFEALFTRMTCESGEDREVALAQFKILMEARQSVSAVVAMTDRLEVKTGNTVRRLEVNEVLETLEEPELDGSAGLMRLYTRAVEDGATGYVTLKTSGGNICVVDYDPLGPLESKVDEGRQDLAASIARAKKYFELKIAEVTRRGASKILKQSCLQEKASELEALVQDHQQLRSAIVDERANRHQRWSEEQKLRRIAEQEAEAGRVAAKVLENSEKLANEISRTALTASVVLGSGNMGDSETSSVLNASTTCEEALEQHLTELAEQLVAHAQSRRAHGLPAKLVASLEQSEARLLECERQCKTDLKELQKQAQKLSEGSVWQALGCAFKSHKGPLFHLFSDSDEQGRFRMKPDALRRLLEGAVQSGDALTTTELDLGVPKVASELTLLEALELGQEYVTCLVPITITSSASVTEGKSLRRLDVWEVLEVLEKRDIHEGVGAGSGTTTRFRCRSLQDGQEGWVTCVGNQGKRFLTQISKPFLICQDEPAQLHESLKISSKPLENGKIEAGSVLELVEGPRNISPPGKLRVNIQSKRDGKMGWATLEDAPNETNFAVGKFLVCLRDTAFTSSFDIGEGRALGKLAAGEALELLSEPQESTEQKLLRAKGRSQRDGREGWVTLRGNLGSPFAEEFEKCYVCTRSVTLDEYSTSGLKVIREIEVGEAFELVEGPVKETSPGVSRILARNPFTGVTGALTVTKSIAPWSREYIVSRGDVSFTPADVVGEENTIRLNVGERIQVNEVPRPGSPLNCKRLKTEAVGRLAWTTQSLSHQATETWASEAKGPISAPFSGEAISGSSSSSSQIPVPSKGKSRRAKTKSKPAPAPSYQHTSRGWRQEGPGLPPIGGPSASASASAGATADPSPVDDERRSSSNTPPASAKGFQAPWDLPETPGFKDRKPVISSKDYWKPLSSREERYSPPPRPNRNPLPTTWQGGAPSPVTTGPDHRPGARPSAASSSGTGTATARGTAPSSSPGVYKSFTSSAYSSGAAIPSSSSGRSARPEFHSGATAQRPSQGKYGGGSNNRHKKKSWQHQPAWRR